jgi:hypothetical protein
MWWKILLQSALASGSLFFGWNFWATVKCSHYKKRILSSPALLDEVATCMGYEWIWDKSANFLFRSGSNNIAQFEAENRSALVIIGNLLLLGTCVVFAFSYVLHPYFLGMDIAIFCAGSLPPINRRMKSNMLSEIQLILLYLCGWALDDPQDCSAKVAAKLPQFTNALCTVQKIMKTMHTIEDDCSHAA